MTAKILYTGDVKLKLNLADCILKGNIHTIEIQVNQLAPGLTNVQMPSTTGQKYIKKLGNRYIINVSNYIVHSDAEYLSEFQSSLDAIISDAGIIDYKITRIDFKIDNFTSEYRDFTKLNRTLMLMFAYLEIARLKLKKENTKRKVKTTNRINFDNLAPCGVWIEASSQWTIDYYDKAHQTDNRKLCNRLEFRNTATYSNVKEAIDVLCHDLKAMNGKYKKVQEVYNKSLLNAYEYESKEAGFSMIEFIGKHKEFICTTKQLKEFLHNIGEKDIDNKAKRYMRKYGILRYSQKEIDQAIDIYLASIKEFMEG